MKLFTSTTSSEMTAGKWVISIGNFDGLHMGHQAIVTAMKAAAEQTGAAGIAAITFDPHPVAILHPEKAPGILTPLKLKEHLLERAGVDALIVLKDSYDLLNLSPEAFIDEFLLKTVTPTVIVEGPNFNFGYGRSGNIDTLKKLGKDRGFSVTVVSPQHTIIDGQGDVMCSSSTIRRLLEAGSVASAANILNRPYRLIGLTVKGRGIGTTIGFPTANINPANQIIPAEGVYAGNVAVAETFDGAAVSTELLPAVFSIGRAKTFVSDHPLLIEAHVLKEPVGDLYGKYLALDFVEEIRNQQRFADHEELAIQIKKDCDTALNILAKYTL